MGREQLWTELEGIYTDLDRELAALRPLCQRSGRCCRFKDFGHQLWTTGVELDYLERVDSHTFEVNSFDEMKARAEDGFLLAHWNGDAKVEKRIKDELQLTTRNRPFDLKQEPGKCIVTGEPSPGRIVFSRAY